MLCNQKCVHVLQVVISQDVKKGKSKKRQSAGTSTSKVDMTNKKKKILGHIDDPEEQIEDPVDGIFFDEDMVNRYNITVMLQH